MIVDASVLRYAVERTSPHHEAAAQWLEGAFNGHTRVGLPWASLTAFLRISTNPRITVNTLTREEAWWRSNMALPFARPTRTSPGSPAVRWINPLATE